MRRSIPMLLMAVLLLVACQYESPLTTEHAIAVDPAVLGIWEPAPEKEGEASPDERMVILQFSDTEYLIHYPPGGNDEIYYRGYPIEIGGIACVQLEAIGTEDGPLQNEEKAIYYVAAYRLLADGRLEIRTLNTDLVDKSLTTSEELKSAFIKHKDDKELFNEPAVFRKIIK